MQKSRETGHWMETQPKPTITRDSSDNLIFGTRLCTESRNTRITQATQATLLLLTRGQDIYGL